MEDINAENLITVIKLRHELPDSIREVNIFRNELTMTVDKKDIKRICTFLRDDDELKYDFLSDLCGLDFPDRHERFCVIYNLYSIELNHRVRLKVFLKEEESIQSIVPVYPTANWHEREVFDMFGIRFDEHPDLRRILMPEDWQGHPLRKDYPLRGEDGENSRY